MCLILFGVRPNEQQKLVVAANRDEFYGRPASRADFWDDHPQVLGGRDLEMGGTWLGITKQGRFAAVTNFRETPADPIPPRSRGELTAGFLTSEISALEYLKEIQQRDLEYRGFNLVLDDGKDFYYYSNQEHEIRQLSPGTYGLSNQLLDCDWPKVNRGRLKLGELLTGARVADDQLFQLLYHKGDETPFSNSFIETAEYGTCAATVLTISTTGETRFLEQGFTNNGKPASLASFEFQASRV